jgi:hypothetical protein
MQSQIPAVSVTQTHLRLPKAKKVARLKSASRQLAKLLKLSPRLPTKYNPRIPHRVLLEAKLLKR